MLVFAAVCSLENVTSADMHYNKFVKTEKSHETLENIIDKVEIYVLKIDK